MEDLREKVENIEKRVNELNDVFDNISKSLTGKPRHSLRLTDSSGPQFG
jgi:hypothetical protein